MSSSLAEQLSELLDPTVKSIDPEDDIYEETKAKLVEKEDLAEDLTEGESNDHSKRVGGRHMQSLQGMGELYRGKIVSRNEMNSDDDSGQGDLEERLHGETDDELSSDPKEDADDDDSEVKEDDRGGFEDLDDMNGMDEEIDSDEADGDENVKIFKPSSQSDPQSKGKATRNQLALWETMLEARIKCQKILSISNKLPKHDMMEAFSDQAGKSVASTDMVLGNLLLKLLELEAKVLRQNPQTQHIANSDCCTKKRKNSTPLEDIDQDIDDRFSATKGHRNKVLKLWYDKTRLTSTSANVKSKSFSSFERSTVLQIEDILQDADRLLKRTQLKRSEYRILGTESTKPVVENDVSESHSSHLKEFDEEIFDDDDFYHQLLRQLIEQKASGPGGSSDPVELTRQWLRIQRLRAKVKKNVDTKASKGRKIRYEIHQKLQSFMAPNDMSTFSHEARNQLFKSLFGNIPDTELLLEQ